MALKNWFVVVSFRTELLSEYACQNGLKYFSKNLGIDFAFKNRKNVDNDICGTVEEYAEFQKLVENDYARLIPHFFKVIEAKSKAFIDYGKKLNAEKLKKISNSELAGVFREYYDLYEQAAGLIGVPASCEFALIEVLKKKVQVKDFDSFLKTISFTEKKTKTFEERLALLQITKKVCADAKLRRLFAEENPEEIIGVLERENKVLLGEIKRHSEDYSWIMKTLFLGEDHTPLKIVAEIKVEIGSDPQNKIDKIMQGLKLQEKEMKSLNLQLKLSDDVKKDILLMQDLVYFRNARLEWLNEGCQCGVILLDEVAKRLSLSFEQVIYLMPQEIEGLLNGKSKISKSEIDKRIKKYALVMEDFNISLYTDSDVEKHKVAVVVEDVSELKGLPASPGKVKGKVKVVKDRSELGKVEKGDVLVTKLTTPDFVVAMQKSVAVVTDLGGITSHAAIVSRELGIPCVVGTKNATKVLKDGDIVEVDAEKGIVRKVK